MGYDFNQVRKPNAKLGTTDEVIKKAGTFYAVTYGYDGLSYVKVNFPDFVKDFLQGNTTTTEFFTPTDIESLRPYALSGFPNLNNLTILNETEFVTINTNAFNGTKIGNKEQGSIIYVVNTFYDDYVSNYGALYNFASYESKTWYVVNYEKVETAILTQQILNGLDIPLNFSGLVIASDITYVTSISVSELESIIQMWLKGANDLIFDLDELPNGWVYDNGTLYVSPSDYDTFIANHTGYENYISKEYSMTISGSGTLTSEIVESAIDYLTLIEVPVSIVAKLVIPSTFTDYENYSLDILNNSITNLNTVECGFNINYWSSPSLINLYSDFSLQNGKVKNLIINSASQTYRPNIGGIKSVNYLKINNFISFSNANQDTIINGMSNLETLELPDIEILGGTYGWGRAPQYIYLPKVTQMGSWQFQLAYTKTYLFVGTNNATCGNSLFRGTQTNSNISIFVKANCVKDYKVATNWVVFSNNFVGVLDGNNVYSSKGFDYPKLNTNLTLDTSNGHLYSNETDLFDGYNATWYSDKDCTTTINPSDITSAMTVYVKLTAI